MKLLDSLRQMKEKVLDTIEEAIYLHDIAQAWGTTVQEIRRNQEKMRIAESLGPLHYDGYDPETNALLYHADVITENAKMENE